MEVGVCGGIGWYLCGGCVGLGDFFWDVESVVGI